MYDENLSDYVAKDGIFWTHATVRAPWRGSVYEKMIGNIKYCLKRMVGKRPLNIEELQTIATEVENKVNSRPLTAVIIENLHENHDR